MKFSLIIIIAAALLCSCSYIHKKTKSNVNELSYRDVDTTAGTLSARLGLTADMASKEVTAQIKLTNLGPAALDMEDIVIATVEGLRSTPVTGFEHFLLYNGKDTTLLLKFMPLNNLKEYKITGMPGILKPAYTVCITYKNSEKNSPVLLSLKSSPEKDAYQAYLDKYKKPLTGYSFNTKTGFNEKQKKYMKTLKLGKQLPFVYLSEQELAIAGLNFRFKSYYQHDTVYAELFIVNHAEFAVKVIKDALNITVDNKPNTGEAKTVTANMVPSAQQSRFMVEKGERVLINLKKYLKIENPGNENLTFNFSKAFILAGNKALFNEDVELLPIRF